MKQNQLSQPDFSYQILFFHYLCHITTEHAHLFLRLQAEGMKSLHGIWISLGMVTNWHVSSLPLHSHYTASEQIILSVDVFQTAFPHNAFFWQRQGLVHPSARKRTSS